MIATHAPSHRGRRIAAAALVTAVVLPLARPATLVAQMERRADADGAAAPPHDAPGLDTLFAFQESELRQIVERYSEDRGGLARRWTVPYSSERRGRFRAFYEEWLAALGDLDFADLELEGRIDHVLLDRELDYRLALLDREAELEREMEPFLPWMDVIVGLEERRRAREPVTAEEAAARLAELPDRIADTRDGLEARMEDGGEGVSKIVALRAVGALDELGERLESWYEFYAGYDPVFTWWNREPYARAAEGLTEYTKFLREDVIGYEEGEDEPIVGDPIGADGMRDDLVHEMITYTPEELIAIAEREFAWCEARMLGYGDDWKAALEHVKTLHREPGGQIALVRELAEEAVAFIEERDLVTVPPLAKEIWRIEMLSPEQQKVSPFFLGGEVIRVAYPTDEMEHADKLMSMRGNNEHFARATVHHELIPGHHLQGFMTERFNPHRGAFSTPFWGEGWALYWEMLLWDLGFPQSPEDRVGMLFWRMHRAARIIFSLSFHLERMTPEEAVDFLVDRVGHERANAEAEVRRSFNGSYSPLYQAAYMIGGLQIRALHEELVGSGRMTDREFHDAILQGGRMPIEMVRARLVGEPPERDFEATWRFYGDPLDR